jgi:DNA mismatch repair protein MutL
VRERTLAATLKQAYLDRLPPGSHPVACVFVEPPVGTVDVNVHPQKSEVRFSAAQRVYAATRELIDEGLADAPWRTGTSPRADDAGTDAGQGPHAWAAGERSGTDAALAGWSRREGLAGALPAAHERSDSSRGSGYRLGTRAAGPDYGDRRQEFRGEVDRLRSSLAAPDDRPRPGLHRAPLLPAFEDAFDEPREPSSVAGGRASAMPDTRDAGDEAQLRMLTCLPDRIAVFELDRELLVADLFQLRAHLVRRRLARELAATTPDGQAPAQALLQPIVVARTPDQRERLLGSAVGLRRLGLDLEGFSDTAVLVRAVPAVLPKLLDAHAIGALLDRLIPWLHLRTHSVDEAGFAEAIAQLSATRSGEVSPRMAKQWIVELLRDADPGGDPLAAAGVRRWSAAALLNGRSDER